MTSIVGVGVIQTLLGVLQQTESAYPDPDDLEGKACSRAEQHDVARDPCITRVKWKEEGDEGSRKEQKGHLVADSRARECAQVRKIDRIYAQVDDHVTPFAEETRMVGEIEPVIGVEDGGGNIEKVNRARDTRFSAAMMETHSEEDAPKEANHHRKRNYPVVK